MCRSDSAIQKLKKKHQRNYSASEYGTIIEANSILHKKFSKYNGDYKLA